MMCATTNHTTDFSCNIFAISSPYWAVFPIFLHLSIEHGVARVLYPGFNPEEPWIMFYQPVRMAFSNPMQMLQMIRTERTDKVNLKNVVLIHLGGNSVTHKHLDEIRSALPHTLVCLTYSQTEVFRNLISFEKTISGMRLAKKYPYSVGTIVQGFSYKVVDVVTEEVLGPNKIGELRIKSRAQFIGYFREDSSECFDSDGWLKTGDLFYYNEDLCFYMVDRIKESFKYLHHHISPVEIESVIMDLDQVETAVVIGVPHEIECNHSMAVVKLKPNSESISAETIIKYVEEKLEDKKRLRGGVKFVNDIPMTVNGKINRFKLKIVNNIIYTPDYLPALDPKGVGHYYYTQMLKNNTKIAQIEGFTKKEDTFGSLLQRCIRTALTMIDFGIRPGDHISLCSDHHLDSAIPHIASYFTGSIMGAVDPTMSVAETSYLLEKTLPKIIFTIPSAVELIENVIERIGSNAKIVVFGETVHHTPFSKFLHPHLGEHSYKPIEIENLNDIALIVFSSGSSGRPKAICYSHCNILCSTTNPTKNSVGTLFSISSPYWNVFPVFLHLSVEFGLARVIFPSYNPEKPWIMFYQSVIIAFANPLQMLQMVRTEKTDIVDLKNVKLLYLGGNPVTQKQLDEIRFTIPNTFVCLTYSQTEVFRSLICFEPTIFGIGLAKKYPYSVGTIVQGLSYKVVDIETEEILGPNQIGELRIKSRAQFIGYYKQDSSECFDSDGWLKTGDLFYYNEDLCFFIVDRIKESFKYFHHHISPVEIESVIMDLEQVETAVVVGMPHETECNHPMAIVKLKPNDETVSAEMIVKYVEERVEDKKQLRGGVKFINQIPMTVNGKINRFKLKTMVLNKEI
ncbi:hypothetical protein FQR65_LT10376 [Abscondita terminalis]|nr:hypothetical protein FQR65_LT10376 [Abscondita terminalis]